MKNLTVSIHDETYIEARIWALRRGTAVSALVEKFLETLNESDTPGLAFSDGGLEAGLDALDGPPPPCLPWSRESVQPIIRGANRI
jgi:hypothetical protein